MGQGPNYYEGTAHKTKTTAARRRGGEIAKSATAMSCI